jgi:hypothetical protein
MILYTPEKPCSNLVSKHSLLCTEMYYGITVGTELAFNSQPDLQSKVTAGDLVP